MVILFSAAVMVWPAALWAHGVVGKRFFPETVAIEDPFPADEADLPAFSHRKGPDGKEWSIGIEVQKRLTVNTGLAVEGEYMAVNPDQAPNTHGFANPEFTLKYLAVRSPDHEWIFTPALTFEAGGIGADQIGAESHSLLIPRILFGKGFGDLPDSLAGVRPVALVGSLGLSVPLGPKEVEENILSYGLHLAYSFPYLQQFVKDVGIPFPFSKLHPFVEMTFETPVNGVSKGQTEAFARPGLTWTGKYTQISLEATLPLNDRTGGPVGVEGMFHLYLDDIAPGIFRPLFGSSTQAAPGPSR